MALISNAVGFARPFPAMSVRCRGRPRKLLPPRQYFRLALRPAADQSCRQIAHHVAVEIGEQQHVELLRIDDDLHAGVIDNQFPILDVRMSRDRAAARNSPSQSFMMLALWMAWIFLRPCLLGIFEGEVGDPRRRLLGDDLQALHHAGNDFVLEAGIQILGISRTMTTSTPRSAISHRASFLRGANSRTGQGFSQCHVHAGGAAGNRSGHRPF